MTGTEITTLVVLFVFLIALAALLFAWRTAKRERGLCDEHRDQLVAENRALKAKVATTEEAGKVETQERKTLTSRLADLRTSLMHANGNLRLAIRERDEARKARGWFAMHTNGKQYRVVRIWPATRKKDERIEEVYVGHSLEAARSFRTVALASTDPNHKRSRVALQVSVVPRWSIYEDGDENGGRDEHRSTYATGGHLPPFGMGADISSLEESARKLAAYTAKPELKTFGLRLTDEMLACDFPFYPGRTA